MKQVSLLLMLIFAGCCRSNTAQPDLHGLSPDVAKNGKYALALAEQISFGHAIDEKELAMAMAKAEAGVSTTNDKQAYESLQLFREFAEASTGSDAIRVRVTCQAAAINAFRSKDPEKYFPPSYEKCKSAFADLNAKKQS